MAAAYQIGYRAALITGGAGALGLAQGYDWPTSYLVMACLAGIGVQLIGIPLPSVLATTIDMVGKAALPLGLLAVGASLDLADARARPTPVIVATMPGVITALPPSGKCMVHSPSMT